MITPEFLLTPREFGVLWQDLWLGRMPYPLDVPTEQERRALREKTLDDLRERGLVGNQRLEGFLRLLDDHEVSVDAVAGLDLTVRALAVSNGGQAVLAIIDGDRVGLLTIRKTGLAREIVRVLPDREAGPGTAMNVRVESLQQAVALQESEEDDSDDPWGAADDEIDDRAALQRAGLSTQDAKQFGELPAHRVAGGQFGVTHGRAAVGRGHQLVRHPPGSLSDGQLRRLAQPLTDQQRPHRHPYQRRARVSPLNRRRRTV